METTKSQSRKGDTGYSDGQIELKREQADTKCFQIRIGSNKCEGKPISVQFQGIEILGR